MFFSEKFSKYNLFAIITISHRPLHPRAEPVLSLFSLFFPLFELGLRYLPIGFESEVLLLVEPELLDLLPE